ncbi:MAG: META domain-containing protein [Methylomicrobium sp.]|nr:META domain-containing protein [Methylomicrobium sp.]
MKTCRNNRALMVLVFSAIAGCGTLSSVSTTKPVPTAEFLKGREWLLEDLGGHGVLDRVQVTLKFHEKNKISGRASCNQYSGQVEIDEKGGFRVQNYGTIASTKMRCPAALSLQEGRYLEALGVAERIELNEPYLFIYSPNLSKPLKFIQK